MFAFGILKPIYSPLKAFKELAQNPKYHGPILILILFVATYVGSAYVILSKTYDEQTFPTIDQRDIWTENRTGWISNADISESSDAVTGGFFGNKSLEFSVTNNTQIWMEFNLTENVDCAGPTGYRNMSFRTKLIRSDAFEVNDVSLCLFSSPADYFSKNLSAQFVSSNSVTWNNVTISIGPESGWTGNGVNANWSNINALKLAFSLSANANWTVRVDGLFFRGVFKSTISSATSYLFSFSMFAVMLFVIRWILLGGLLYMLTKAAKGKLIWKALIVLMGFALVTMVVQSTINIVLYSTLPTINYPLEAIGGAKGESDAAFRSILDATLFVTQASWIVQIITHIWTFALCAIIIRQISELSWSKSTFTAVAAYMAAILAENLILGY